MPITSPNVTAETRQRIIDAATTCIRKYGLSKTAMADIAEVAGLSRKTLYRVFNSRHDLFNAVVLNRAQWYVDRLRHVIESAPSFEDALVQSTLDSFKWFRKDNVFISAIEGASERGVERYLVDPGSVLHKTTLALWHDFFRKARERGELRRDLTDHEVASCVRAAMLMLWLRDDLSPAEQEDYLRRLLLPSLAPPDGVRKATSRRQ